MVCKMVLGPWFLIRIFAYALLEDLSLIISDSFLTVFFLSLPMRLQVSYSWLLRST